MMKFTLAVTYSKSESSTGFSNMPENSSTAGAATKAGNSPLVSRTNRASRRLFVNLAKPDNVVDTGFLTNFYT